MVSVLGMGGIGKSALATNVMHRGRRSLPGRDLRSLRDAPACETLLEECLKVLAPQPLSPTSRWPRRTHQPPAGALESATGAAGA